MSGMLKLLKQIATVFSFLTGTEIPELNEAYDRLMASIKKHGDPFSSLEPELQVGMPDDGDLEKNLAMLFKRGEKEKTADELAEIEKRSLAKKAAYKAAIKLQEENDEKEKERKEKQIAAEDAAAAAKKRKEDELADYIKDTKAAMAGQYRR